MDDADLPIKQDPEFQVVSIQLRVHYDVDLMTMLTEIFERAPEGAKLLGINLNPYWS